jgi:hypothetical protein
MAKCRMGCPDNISRKDGKTKNIKRHLENEHKEMFDEYMVALKEAEELSSQQKTALYAKLDLIEPADSLQRYFEYLPDNKAKCRIGCLQLERGGSDNSMIRHLRGHKQLFKDYTEARKNV